MSQKKCQPPTLLKRPTPIPYFHPLLLIYRIPPWREEKKFTPPLKRGDGPNYVDWLTIPKTLSFVGFFLFFAYI